MENIEVISDQPYFEPDTVKIAVHNWTHHGKFWQHTHAFYEFVYVMDGFTLHSYNGNTSVLTSGDLFVIYPGNVHSYIASYNTKIFNILFYIDELAGMTDELKGLPGILWDPGCTKTAAFPVVSLELGERRRMVELLEAMVRERKEKNIGWELNLRGMLINFLIMYSRVFSKKNISGGDNGGSDARRYSTYIYGALKFIEDNYTKDISTEDIAAAVGVSGDYLTRKFKEAMCVTPIEYVRRFRISKAMNLLKTSDMSVSEIAVDAGFGDVSIFSRVFKKTVGVSPMAFRKGEASL